MTISNFLVNAGLLILSLLLGYLLSLVISFLWSPIIRKIYKVDKMPFASRFPIGFKKNVEYLSNLSVGIAMGIIHSIMYYKYSINFNLFVIFYVLFCFEFCAQKRWALTDALYYELYSTDKKIFIKLKIINALGYIIALYIVMNFLFIYRR